MKIEDYHWRPMFVKDWRLNSIDECRRLSLETKDWKLRRICEAYKLSWRLKIVKNLRLSLVLKI